MTLASEAIPKIYAGNGVTDEFSFPYKFNADADLVVVLTNAVGQETVQTLTTHYTVAGAGNPAGGTVTMLTPPATGETLTIYRQVDNVQETDLSNQGAYFLETLENALDYLTMITQQISELVSRCIQIAISADVTDVEMTPSASKFLRWNDTADGLSNVELSVISDLVLARIGGNNSGDLITTDDVQDLTNKTYDGGEVGGTAAGDIATIDGAQTLTNKTLTDPIMQTPSINASQVDATGTEINKAADGIGVSIPRQKIVQIGDWNMDSNNSVNVAHGLTLAKIVGCRGIIINDAESFLYPFCDSDTAGELSMYIGATEIVLARLVSGFFDSASFDSTSFNRGYLIFDYID